MASSRLEPLVRSLNAGYCVSSKNYVEDYQDSLSIGFFEDLDNFTQLVHLHILISKIRK